jgi:hypothetical protein
MPRVFFKIRFRQQAAWQRGWRLCAWLSTALYLGVALGFSFPMPQPITEAIKKDAAQPFPCMNSPCGCRNAEQCWRHCCCHTLGERLEWAWIHHVQPPDYVLAEAKAQGIDWQGEPEHDRCVDLDGCAIPRETCCHCSAPASSSGEHGGDGVRGHAGLFRTKPSVVAGIVIIKALECQGIASNWLVAIVSLAPPSSMRWSMAWNPTGRITDARQARPSFTAQPPTPPPRLTTI